MKMIIKVWTYRINIVGNMHAHYYAYFGILFIMNLK